MTSFVRNVFWTRISGRNTRYTLYQSATNDSNFKGRRLAILVVPGNPGNDRFYNVFCEELMHRVLLAGHSAVLCSLSHANHVVIDDDKPVNYTVIGNYQLSDFIEHSSIRYNLYEQINHTADFCRNIYASYAENREIIFIGHSIGALIALRAMEVLRDVDKSWYRWDSSCFAVFPAVERMADTPQGYRLQHILNFLQNYDTFTRILSYSLCELLPRKFKNYAVEWFIGPVEGQEERNGHSTSEIAQKQTEKRTPRCVVDAATEIARTNVIRNIVYMSAHELDVVKEFDSSCLQKAADAGCRVHFFYTFGDGWGPVEFGREMRSRIAILSGDIESPHTVEIDEEARFEHAFVIRDSREMAARLSGYIVGNNTSQRIAS